jgi:hypothetical protein
MDNTIRHIFGSTVRAELQNERSIRTDDDGYLAVVGGSSDGLLIGGVAADNTTINPFRQVDFVPQAAGDGWRSTLTNVNQELGAMTVDKTHHITPSVDCWALVGPTGGTAVVGDGLGAGTTFLKGGATYEWIPRMGADYIAFIRDTDSVDGFIAVSRVES